MVATRLLGALMIVALVTLTLGCSSASDEPAGPQTATAGDPTSPSGDETPVSDAPLPVAPLTAAPTCGAAGAHVLLSLDWTSDKRVPECMHPEKFSVRFGSKPAKVTMVGKNYYGYCAVDVIVPQQADSDVVTVTIDKDVFKSSTAFAVPCH